MIENSASGVVLLARPAFSVGDTLNIHVRIIEGEKERIQVFQGVLIAAKGRGINRMITVRRIVANEGVERVFPLHSPRLAEIEVVRRGALELVNAAPATDEIRLAFFTDGLGVESRIRPAFAGDATDTLSGAEMRARETTALRVVREWQDDPRFQDLADHLDAMTKRLRLLGNE